MGQDPEGRVLTARAFCLGLRSKTANLIDGCRVDDGWSAVNRGDFSTGAGHTATENVFWNTTGSGILRSRQFGWGYVIGTGPGLTLVTAPGDDGSDPADGKSRLAYLSCRTRLASSARRRTSAG